MAWWNVPDVTSWTLSHMEPRGIRAKQWIVDSNAQPWLRKEPRSSRPFEPAIEALTLELGRRCQLDPSDGRACTWLVDGLPRRGFVSRMFHDRTESQSTGGELVGSLIDAPYSTMSEKDRARSLITLEVVRCALRDHEDKYSIDLCMPFVRMLVFDAWIGNSDRHCGNWALLYAGERCRLAPMYDTAACLGAELQEATVDRLLSSATQRQRYVDRCKTGFGDGATRPGMFQREILAALKQWPQWEAAAGPLISEISRSVDGVREVVEAIPDEWLPQPRRELALLLLRARVTMLEKVASP